MMLRTLPMKSVHWFGDIPKNVEAYSREEDLLISETARLAVEEY